MKKILPLMLILAMFASCTHRRDIIGPYAEADYEARYSTDGDPLNGMLNADSLSDREKDALRFLYAYLPLPDVADYEPDFYLANIRSTFEAMDEMPWGDSVPDREFRHFVLPVRVNNEDLDMSRPVMLAELRERVRGLSMAEAILEVNHWCHEKATYRPSDSRTNSPLATMRSALGRCGEESTFTVAALRSVGIPARQVYTPRWAHTDDNHAWVEAWADGKWHFLGACEPEPVLDLGWFNAPASRGMLMNTSVFGRYDGPEEVLEAMPLATVINVTDNYAPVDEIKVAVVDPDGKAVDGARVNFSLYNYAEFYPVAVRYTDSEGCATLLAGNGDMIAWASDGNRFGLAKVHAGQADTVVIRPRTADFSLDFNIVPPHTSAAMPELTDSQVALNECRKAAEDSIRRAYESTFTDAEAAANLARNLGLPADRLTPVMACAKGNHDVIERFLSDTPAESRAKALDLLTVISEKDLNDVTPEVLSDHLSTPEQPTPLYASYVLNPRVDRERLTPYKSFFASVISPEDMEKYRSAPSLWATWVADSISPIGDLNPRNLRMSPEGVWKTRRADNISRSIFFVAGARSMGIPARIDPVSGKTQYAAADKRWVDVDFGEPDAEAVPEGRMVLSPVEARSAQLPGYYTHFSLSRIEDGLPQLLNYDESATVSDFSSPVSTDTGHYMLLTGRRMADGSVMAHAEFFTVAADSLSKVPFVLRDDPSAISVIGNFNSEDIYYDKTTGSSKSILSTTGRGYYALGLIRPGHEPSVHALNDLSAAARELDKWGRPIVLLFPDRASLERFDTSAFPGLPAGTVLGVDEDGKIAAEIASALNLDARGLPIFIIADTFNRVVFASQGYTIGLGQQMAEVASRLNE